MIYLSRSLIIGTNSRIVKSIKDLIDGVDIISHAEINNVNYDAYDKIFLFSWSFRSLEENLIIIKKFPLDKVVFISSVAVLACSFRPQWANYPKHKLICENLVLSGGGNIIRIGVWDLSLINHLPGTIPITTPELLLGAMSKSISQNGSVSWPIKLVNSKQAGIRLVANKLIGYTSLRLPCHFIFQVPISIVAKLFGLKYHSYSHDSLQFFSQRILVGYGVVGAAVSKELNLHNQKHAIIVSKDVNRLLNTDGFSGTRIGQFKEGLSKFWHGVHIIKKNGGFKKSVPLFISRPSVPRGSIFGTVFGIDYSLLSPSVKIRSSEVFDLRAFGEVIHLSAGVINNIKILQDSQKIIGYFSDHEVGEIGIVKTQELLARNLIYKKLGIVFGRNIIVDKWQRYDYMLDFRPSAPNFFRFDSQNLYNNRLSDILLKLVKLRSIRLLNQAVFNKFGFALDVGAFTVVAQISVSNCIMLNSLGQLQRSRISFEAVRDFVQDVSNKFQSFTPIQSPSLVDAIHIHGGFNLDDFPDLLPLIQSKKLYLHGNSLDKSPLGAFHQTVQMAEREKSVIKQLFLSK